jgi:hypothetical protein
MQRLFTMFPRGLPGLALLLLRASVAIALLMESYGRGRGLSAWIYGTAWLLSAALCVGYLTPVVTSLALVLQALIWFDFGGDSPAMAVIVFLDALALALLGPGAYSLDSYRFGRRLVVLPPT